MADVSQDSSMVSAAIARARGRWLLSATVNAGGRWAALPAFVVALIGMTLALAGVESLAVYLPLTLLAVLGCVCALVLTRLAYSRPAAAGAPDWTLLLDRALGLDDALPALLEAPGEFRPALEAEVAARLDPVKERLAAPPRNWSGLVVALLLCALPLVMWRQAGAEASEGAAIAEAPAPDTAAPTTTSQPQPGSADPDGENPAEGSSSEGTGGGDEGEVQRRPGEEAKGGAGQPPEDVKPESADEGPQPESGGMGDESPLPTDIKKPEDSEVETDLNKIIPDAGDGETRPEDRSRWVYDPEGSKLDESTPQPRETMRGAERAMARTKIRSSERRLIEGVFKKLYE